MLQIQRPLCPELTFRLAHDISPDNYPDEDDEDEETTNQKEAFILSCLAQSNANVNNNNNNTVCPLGETACDKVDKISETFAQLEWKQNHFEKINNEINKQHLTKSLEDNNNHINIINNNVVPPALSMSVGCEREKVKPSTSSHGYKIPRRPRKLPEIPKKTPVVPACTVSKPLNEKCLADELQEALVRTESDTDSSDNDDVFLPNSKALPKVYPKFSGKFLEELRQVKFNTISKNTRAYLNSDNVYLKEDSTENNAESQQACMATASGRGRKDSNGGEGKKCVSSFPSTNYQDLEVTHRGMHRFVPRHKDEMTIEIGDPIHVTKTGDDLWCEGINLRTNQRGIFPSMYATDLQFLEEDGDEDGCAKFHLRFLGSVEVNYHKGDEILCQAINKVALSRRANKTSIPPPVCTLEVSQYGIRMFDKSKTAHENLDVFTHFFALKNISFCGYHPRNERYFGFITKHPNQYRYACHVFLGEKSTRSVSEALGNAFKRFYQEYMAFTHPTEDIYME